MKINSGYLIRKMRKDIGLSQEKLAERLYISTRQLSRIETGEIEMDVWQFISILELMGQPTEDFWLLYLDSGEYEDYKAYKRLKRFLRDGLIEEAENVLSELEKKDLSKRPFISQFIAFAKIIISRDMLPEQALDGLDKAIRMSRPDFDEVKISGYRLTYNEVYIIMGISLNLHRTGEKDRAVNLIKAIIESRENVRASEEDKAAVFPFLMFNLSNMLGENGNYKESLKYCNSAIEVSREYNNLRLVPKILYNIACCNQKIGEEERIYKPFLIRAYHCAYAMGNYEDANAIKDDAEKSFGIVLQ